MSFFFIILELLDEHLPWRNKKVREDMEKYKARCLEAPLMYFQIKNELIKEELYMILAKISKLEYGDKPDYQNIRLLLERVMKAEKGKIIGVGDNEMFNCHDDFGFKDISRNTIIKKNYPINDSGIYRKSGYFLL